MSRKSLLFLSLILTIGFVNSLPLSTKGRWIVDAETGDRVKLHCANWPTHTDALLAEGLHARPLSEIVAQLANTGFNCIRLTWATYMFTRPEYGLARVTDTFDKFSLYEAKVGIENNNPEVLNMTHVQAYFHVVDELGKQGILVDADNHLSKPGWCCSDSDGNGFFGDEFNDYKEWLRGITTVANLAKGKSNVVAIGLRNEPRGPHQKEDGWYKYFLEGATKVHEVNPDLLVMISGMNYSTTLSHLKNRTFGTNLDNKLVFEAHWYGWDNGWAHPINKACHDRIRGFVDKNAFVTAGENPVPIFVGEFGIDQRGLNLNEDHFMSCVLPYMAEQDLDFGFWGFQGSYYYRQNVVNMEEFFGVMDYHWNRIRNPALVERMQIIQRTNRDPKSTQKKFQILYHSQGGTCVSINEETKEVHGSSCKGKNLTRFEYLGDGHNIWHQGKEKCLKAVGDGEAPILTGECDGEDTKWTTLSETGLHIGTRDESGEYLCLQKESPHTYRVVTNKCVLIEEDSECKIYPQTDPTSQWFKFVDTNLE